MPLDPATPRFENIYHATYHKLYGFVKYYLKDEDAAKDVLQECYIRLWEKLPVLTDDEKLMPMLRTWAMHITIDAVRKKARETARSEAWQYSLPQTCTADEGLTFRDTMQQYREAVEGLPSQQKLVFKLVREEGLSHKEIASQLKISTHTIKRHLNEALRTLRQHLPAGLFILMEIHLRK